MREVVQHPFSPIAGPGSRTLILGTMASPKSRENGFYYGHPQNRFWPALAAVFGQAVPRTPEAREALLLSNGLALWDVLMRCEIDGAADASIRNPRPKRHPRPAPDVSDRARVHDRADGRAALPAARGTADAPALHRAPSPSPANRRVPFDALVEAYAALKG